MSNHFTTKKMTTCALMAALLCILGPLSIPIGPVPISFTNLAIYFSAYILGPVGALWSFLIYFLVGLCGLPVFSGFSAGLGKLMGPTGGFIAGFFFTAFLSGLTIKLFPKNRLLQIAGLFAATLAAYAFGTAWFIIIMKTTLKAALAACVLPFIPGDIAKIVIASFIGPLISNRIKRNI